MRGFLSGRIRQTNNQLTATTSDYDLPAQKRKKLFVTTEAAALSLSFSPFTLKFEDEKIEARFAAQCIRKSLWHIRAAFLIALMASTVFVVGTVLLNVARRNLLALILVGVVLFLLCLSLFFFSFSEHFENFAQTTQVGAVFVVGTGILVVKALVSDYETMSPFALLFFGAYTLSRLKFHCALTVCSLVTLEVSVWLLIVGVSNGLQRMDIMTYVVPLHAANIMSAWGAYFLQRYERNLFARSVKMKAETERLALEEKKSDRILLNILPADIAETLKSDPTASISQRVPAACILFADIVGFTKMASNNPPERVVSVLNNIFCRLDTLTEVYGLEKIKTIGDCYMVATNLHNESGDDADTMSARLVHFGMDLVDVIEHVGDTCGLHLEMRVGLHSGDVVAGCIGIKKWTYDLWGMSVNVAAQMESSGVPGRVQVSEPVRDALLKAGSTLFEVERRKDPVVVQGLPSGMASFFVRRLSRGKIVYPSKDMEMWLFGKLTQQTMKRWKSVPSSAWSETKTPITMLTAPKPITLTGEDCTTVVVLSPVGPMDSERPPTAGSSGTTMTADSELPFVDSLESDADIDIDAYMEEVHLIDTDSVTLWRCFTFGNSETEVEFQRSLYAWPWSTYALRAAVLIGIGIQLMFFLLDVVIDREFAWATSWIYRLTATGVTIACLGITFLPDLPSGVRPSVGLAALYIASGVASATAVLTETLLLCSVSTSLIHFADTRIVVAFMYYFTFFHLNYFGVSVGFSVVVIGLFHGISLWRAGLREEILESDVFLLPTLAVGFLFSYNLQRFMRSEYILNLAFTRKQNLIKASQAASEQLLLDFLPLPIYTRLRNGEVDIADSYGDVSVLFADVVGFSALCTRLSPSEVVDYLTRLFLAFDDIVERLGLTKIKTIGDIYMVCGGLFDANADRHLDTMARCAIEFQDALRDLDAAFPHEEIVGRVGFSVGPVVAGVIGSRKFAFDLWGDTVNVAARMCKYADPSTVLITDDTYNRLKDGPFTFVDRGALNVKGKGEINAWVVSAQDPANGSEVEAATSEIESADNLSEEVLPID